MLAATGFAVAAICFISFATTFQLYVVGRAKLPLQPFAVAYGSLGAAFAMWAAVLASGNEAFLPKSALIADGLIMVGTLCLIYLWAPSRYRWPVVLAAAAAGLALYFLRATYLYPTPYVDQGIVVFNVPAVVVAAISIVLLAVWVPVSASVAGQVAVAIKQPSLRPIYTRLYVGSALAAIVFAGARRPLTVVLAFSVLVLLVGTLIASNYLVKTLKEAPHGHPKSR